MAKKTTQRRRTTTRATPEAAASATTKVEVVPKGNARDARFSTSEAQAVLRQLGAIHDRLQFASLHGYGFEGKRDYYTALGYTRTITPELYWDRYRRNGVARRLVNALPNATWRSGADLVEDDNVDVVTPFEAAWIEFAARTRAWDRMRKGDILSQLGRFSVLLLGYPGALASEAKKTKPGSVAYIKQFSELRVKVQDGDLDNDRLSPRFGQPIRYQFTQLLKANGAAASQYVHWTRVIHIADEAVEDDEWGEPMLASVWNWLDDLEKVAGAGSEAFWRRVQPMLSAQLAPGATMPVGAETQIEEEIDKLVHGLRRWVRLSGVELDEVGSHDVANFDKQIDALISLIVTPYGIPKRIFQGSEQGDLASSQDRGNWGQNIRDRRRQFAESVVLRPLVERLQLLGQLPPTPMSFETRWPDVQDLDFAERLDLAAKAAKANNDQGEQIVTTNEIRDNILDYDPLEADEMVQMPDAANAQVLAARLRDAKIQLAQERARPPKAKKKGRRSLVMKRDSRGRADRIEVEVEEVE
jgi:hypothetical protein